MSFLLLVETITGLVVSTVVPVSDSVVVGLVIGWDCSVVAFASAYVVFEITTD